MICQDAKDLIKEAEGCKLVAYMCPAGIWTIGYGNTEYEGGRKVKKGDEINHAYAELLFDLILDKFEQQVSKVVRVPLNENQLGALVSFTYNLGIGSLKSSTLLRRLNDGDYDVGNEFLKWNKASGKVLKGLTIRREKEKELFLK